MDTPPVIAVIGPVEPELLATWVDHYRRLGAERFLLAFHFADHVPDRRRDELKATCEALGIAPAAVARGPWHEHTNTELRDMLRDRAGTGWHLLADADEFHTYPAPLAEVLAEAEVSGTGTVGGLMLDRVSADGRLTAWSPSPGSGLDVAYPLGGFLTHLLLRGDPRKIVLAHSSVTVDSGNHRAEGHRPANRPPVVVHHFKWRCGVREDLERRAARTADGSWQTRSPALLSEARRLLSHLSLHDGRIDVTAPDVPFRPVSLQETPLWWPEEATRLAATWRPARRSPAR
ncbi:glycosyltransferase family 2 protein [Streptomyces roseirectus]|uniref:Glycosyltransferase family 2 protein n=1 Tax=Streptomyces roseirectus TaxID=2768066 RepID=A0A7H0ICJ3_9ACTN|nr:glycosyltransferase family 2 protein [Streptomyces roseirectus]QNP70509.1 glycosyltransferase family 2 protein [Streptomyces roseirectus]